MLAVIVSKMATTLNRAAVLYGPMDIKMTNVPVPEIAPDEVLLSTGSVGICGSDLKYWTSGKCGKFVLREPMVLGHEASGTVVKVGSKVSNLKIGDRVAVEPGIPCRKCKLCKSGRYNLCPDIFFCATPPDNGTICQLYKHAADFCFKLPDHVSLDEGALLEPLAVAVYSCQRGNIQLGSTALICGAGPVGVLTMLVAKEMGAAVVAMTDIDDYRLAFAKEMGTDHVIKVTTDDPQEVALQVETVIGCQPDVTFECSGTDFSFITGIYATFPGGSVIMVGRGSDRGNIPLNVAASKEVDIKGIFRYANCYPIALDFVAKRKVNVKKLITHHFQLEDTIKAFETARSRDARAVKVVIHCDQ